MACGLVLIYSLGRWSRRTLFHSRVKVFLGFLSLTIITILRFLINIGRCHRAVGSVRSNKIGITMNTINVGSYGSIMI